MPITFTEASTENTYARIALTGAAGSGKTLTALKLAAGLGKRVAVIDTERDTAKLYAHHPDVPKPYFVYKLKKFMPQAYCQVIDEMLATDPAFDVCIIDSISPSWNKQGGVLDIAGENIRGWKQATPEYDKLVEKLTGQNDRVHMIVTLRSKMDYALEPDPATGKLSVRKLGMQPIHRDEFLYEFDIVGSLDQDHTLSFGGIGKTRFSALDKKSFENPGANVAALILEALQGGSER